MSDDLPISDVADDLLVKRLTDSDNTGFSNDLEKGASVDEVPKTASGGFSTASLAGQRASVATAALRHEPVTRHFIAPETVTHGIPAEPHNGNRHRRPWNVRQPRRRGRRVLVGTRR